MKLVIFTDLDGTLLDASYSFDPALPALRALGAKEVPCVICSSKTRPEIELYRARLLNAEPFIAENGGGIFVPRGYFDSPTPYPDPRITADGVYNAITLGFPYGDLRRELLHLRGKGFSVVGFGDMTPGEIARHTGLSESEANLAKQRDFDEPFLFQGDERERKLLADLIRRDGFFCIEGGAFMHLTGPNDKGRAVSILIDLYRREYGPLLTAALGDSHNDIPMLQAVDYAVVVQKTDGQVDPGMKGYGFVEADGPGPKGWNKAVLYLLATF